MLKEDQFPCDDKGSDIPAEAESLISQPKQTVLSKDYGQASVEDINTKNFPSDTAPESQASSQVLKLHHSLDTTFEFDAIGQELKFDGKLKSHFSSDIELKIEFDAICEEVKLGWKLK